MQHITTAALHFDFPHKDIALISYNQIYHKKKYKKHSTILNLSPIRNKFNFVPTYIVIFEFYT